MPSTIWDKYQKLDQISSNSKIKTYKAKMEPIIKEIIPEDKIEYDRIKGRLEKLKNILEIIEIIEENEKFYIVIRDEDELKSKIDNLILTNTINKLTIIKEAKIDGHGKPITKDEILNLFKMEQSMCRIPFERIENNQLKNGHGSGFFCEIEGNFPIKHALFTNNHILNESNLEIGKQIKFKYFEKSILNSPKISEKNITITNDRKTFTNEELDYTCNEIFDSDGIKNYFKIEPKIYEFEDSSKSKIFEKKDIFILQFYDDNKITFSDGNIKEINDYEIVHQASTEVGSSGSPIIKRDKYNTDNYIIGLHKGAYEDENERIYNEGTTFYSILDNIKNQFNNDTINCIYYPDKDKKEIYLIHDYSCDTSKWKNEYIKIYREAKEMNKKLFENYIELYVNDKKINFNYKYKFKESKEIKVKFKFKKILVNMAFVFDGCSSLKSIDFSNFNTSNIIDMTFMFSKCSSLKSLDFIFI